MNLSAVWTAAVVTAPATYGLPMPRDGDPPASRPTDDIPVAPSGDRVTQPSPEDRLQEILEESQRIQTEAPKEENQWAKEWAGFYHSGDGMGLNFSIGMAPDAGLVYTYSGCSGTTGHRSGDITSIDGQVIKASLAWDRGEQAGVHEEETLYVIRWAGRRYLVPEGRMLDFCNEYNSGSLEQLGRNLWIPLHREDQREPAQGHPAVPAPWQPYLLDAPVEAAIVELRSTEQQDTMNGEMTATEVTAVIDAGQADGVFVGMQFSIVFPPDRFGTLEVVSIDEETCTGLFQAWSFAGIDVETPEVGWRLSTRHWLFEGGSGK